MSDTYINSTEATANRRLAWHKDGKQLKTARLTLSKVK